MKIEKVQKVVSDLHDKKACYSYKKFEISIKL